MGIREKKLKVIDMNGCGWILEGMTNLMKCMRSVEYSPDVDALVITLSDKPPEYGEGLGDSIIIHFDEENQPVESGLYLTLLKSFCIPVPPLRKDCYNNSFPQLFSCKDKVVRRLVIYFPSNALSGL